MSNRNNRKYQLHDNEQEEKPGQGWQKLHPQMPELRIQRVDDEHRARDHTSWKQLRGVYKAEYAPTNRAWLFQCRCRRPQFATLSAENTNQNKEPITHRLQTRQQSEEQEQFSQFKEFNT
jgi:hypothetical protein